MLYTVYKVLNLLTWEFYIGVHKTEDPHDDYLGSGKLIRAQVAQHGRENFSKEILASFEKKRDAYRLEAELVDPLLGTPGCLNLHPGGHGGFGYVNSRGLGVVGSRLGVLAGGPSKASLRCKELEASDPDFAQRLRAHRMRNVEIARARGQHLEAVKRASEVWTGQTHTPEARARMSQAQTGVGNSQHGTCWVCSVATGLARKVQAGEVEALVSSAEWVRGRKKRQ